MRRFGASAVLTGPFHSRLPVTILGVTPAGFFGIDVGRAPRRLVPGDDESAE